VLRVLGLVLALGLAGCQLEEPPLVGGTVVSVVEAERATDESEESSRYYEPPMWPEVAWKVEVRLDDGAAVTVTHEGPRRYEAGERVRLLVDADGALLL
jgi:outer membrane lipoprotein SlyB